MTTIKTSFKEVTTEVVTPTLDITVSGYGEEALTSSTLFKRITDDVNSTSNLSIVRNLPYSNDQDLVYRVDTIQYSMASSLPTNLGVLDNISSTVQYIRSITDSVTLNDTYEFNNIFLRNVSDSIVLTDETIVSTPVDSSSSSSVGSTDIINAATNTTHIEGLTSTEVMSFAIEKIVYITDTLYLSEYIELDTVSLLNIEAVNISSLAISQLDRPNTDSLGNTESLLYGMQSYTTNNYTVSGYTGTTGTLI